MSKKTVEQLKPDQPFMLNPKHAAEKDPSGYKFWYCGQMGKNTIAGLFKSVFEEMGVDTKKEHISATSGRKNLLQAGADAMVPSNFLSKMAGHKVEASQLEYMRLKDDSQKAASMAIHRRACGKTENTDFAPLFKAEQERLTKQVDVESEDDSLPEIESSAPRPVEVNSPGLQGQIQQRHEAGFSNTSTVMIPQAGPSHMPHGAVQSYNSPCAGQNIMPPGVGHSYIPNIVGSSFVTPGSGPSYVTHGPGQSFVTHTAGPSYMNHVAGMSFVTQNSVPSYMTQGAGPSYMNPCAGPSYMSHGAASSFMSPLNQVGPSFMNPSAQPFVPSVHQTFQNAIQPTVAPMIAQNYSQVGVI